MHNGSFIHYAMRRGFTVAALCHALPDVKVARRWHHRGCHREKRGGANRNDRDLHFANNPSHPLRHPRRLSTSTPTPQTSHPHPPSPHHHVPLGGPLGSCEGAARSPRHGLIHLSPRGAPCNAALGQPMHDALRHSLLPLPDPITHTHPTPSTTTHTQCPHTLPSP